MEKLIATVKLNKTIYLDKEDNLWSDDNPKFNHYNNDYKVPEDYEFLIKGTILNILEEDCGDEDYQIVAYTKTKRNSILFASIEDALTYEYFDIIKE